jgi:hypothetical protein
MRIRATKAQAQTPKISLSHEFWFFIAIFKRCHPHKATPTLQKCISEAFLKAVKHRPMAHT